MKPEHIETIIEIFSGKKDREYIAKSVDNDKIVEGNYNLSISSYVEAHTVTYHLKKAFKTGELVEN